MMNLILAITSFLCVTSASTAALTDPPSILKLENDFINIEIHNYAKNVTGTDITREFRTLPLLPYANSCIYPGTCPSGPFSHEPENCETCQVGYVKDPEDDTICKYANKDENAFLLTPLRYITTLISLDGKNSTPIMQTGRDAYVRGVDYNIRTNKIFWFNNTDKTIYTAPVLNYVDSEKESTLQFNSSNIEGIAVDWIYNHIYFFDKIRQDFIVSNFNGSMTKVLFNIGLSSSVVTIVVNPLSGWMYWTNADAHCIEKAGLDGSQREVLVSTQESEPHGLVLELVENRMYWSQKEGGGIDSIWSSNFDGSNRKKVFRSKYEYFYNGIRQVALFDTFIYFIAWNSTKIYKINKCHRRRHQQDSEVVYRTKTKIWDLKVYHSTKQPEGENICSTRTEQCSHFCLPAPSPHSDDFVSTTTCSCPDGLYLSSDQRSCVSLI